MIENMAAIRTFGLSGVAGFPVQVEVFSTGGLPGLEVIGLPDASVRESRERVNAAILNSGRKMPPRRMTINLAPADTRKEGPSFDLPIAIGILAANGELLPRTGLNIDRIVFFGELGLDGRLQPVNGALSIVISASEQGLTEVILPADNAREVSCIQGMKIYPARSLTEVIDHLEGKAMISPQEQQDYADLQLQTPVLMDLSQVRGQQGARRALEVAAAGGHNMLMIGAPGSGKTMMARCLPGILPPLSFAESLETTRIHSIAGQLAPGSGLMIQRPFRAPHHSASVASLIGGGTNARPGEVSLAHNGVLFLDELPEFSRSALESLRQPLEDGVVTVSRIRNQARYQSSFMLIAGMNPCPCGYFGSRQRDCRCSPTEIRRYLDQVSGPLLDRIDLQIEVDSVPVTEISEAPAAESSASVAKRVRAARKIQQERYRGTSIHCNARLDNASIDEFCPMSTETKAILHMAVDKMHLSMRAYHRIIKVARTIADMSGNRNIGPADIAEAVQYRELDQKYWRK